MHVNYAISTNRFLPPLITPTCNQINRHHNQKNWAVPFSYVQGKNTKNCSLTRFCSAKSCSLVLFRSRKTPLRSSASQWSSEAFSLDHWSRVGTRTRLVAGEEFWLRPSGSLEPSSPMLLLPPLLPPDLSSLRSPDVSPGPLGLSWLSWGVVTRLPGAPAAAPGICGSFRRPLIRWMVWYLPTGRLQVISLEQEYMTRQGV